MRDRLALLALAASLATPVVAQAPEARLREAERMLARERALQQDARRDARAAAEAQRRAEAERGAAIAAWRRAEGDAVRGAERLAEATRASERAEADLAGRTRALEPLLPMLQRLALFPAETVLVEPGPPAERLAALAVLRSLAGTLAARAEELADAARATGAARAQAEADQQALVAALATARERAGALDRAAAAARQDRQEAEAEEAEHARKVAAAASSAADVRNLVGRLDAASPPRPAAAPAAAPAAPSARAPARAPAAGAGVRSGSLAWPVQGSIVASAAEDADGPGIGIAAAPAARVLAPCGGRVAYAGPFRSLGPLLILDCGDGYHIVLAGMERLDASVGQGVRPGDPLGSMPAFDPRSGRRAVLSMELRRAGRALDPGPYLSRQQDRIGG